MPSEKVEDDASGLEKQEHHEDVAYETVDEFEKNRILRKVDWRLLPVLTLLYTACYIDRSNIGNAKIAGMSDELNLSGPQYNIALTVFFLPYGLLEVPSNIMLKLMRASIWVGLLMIAWGTVVTLTGIVKDHIGLTLARLALGITEAGFFPASTFILTTWYKRLELQTRMAVFYSAGSLASAFSGLLAFAIENMDGVGGLRGWRWIFLLEGMATVVLGLVAFFILPDGPDTASFLTPGERHFLCHRLREDTGTETGHVELKDAFHWPSLRAAFNDRKIWMAMVIFWGNTVSIYSFTYTTPSVILGLGYTAANAQLLTIPLYMLSVIGTPIIAWFADKYQTRWPFIVGPFAFAAVGFIGLLSVPHPRLPGLTYAFLFTIPLGVSAPMVGLVSWIGNNLAPSWKRAVGMALLMTVGQLGGAVGSNIFLERQAPHYWLGYGFGLGTTLAAMAAAIILKFEYQRLNREKEAMGTEAEILARFSEQELLEMGDKSPLFKYIV